DMAKAKKGIPLIFHKRNNKPETVTMLKEDFYNLMMTYNLFMKQDIKSIQWS
ncbi:hypothetical protein LCGC14_2659440, partial [marine sediment metagenome]